MNFYPSCAALRADLKVSFDEMWLQEKAWISASIDMDRPVYGDDGPMEEAQPAEEGAGVEGATNVQERGVDESDRFRVGDAQIFALSSDEFVQVLDRVTFQRMGNIHLPGLTRTQLLTAKGRLIVLGQLPDEIRSGGDCRTRVCDRRVSPCLISWLSSVIRGASLPAACSRISFCCLCGITFLRFGFRYLFCRI